MAREPASKLDIGQVGERLVCQWLRSHHFQIQDERWHCRLGELDIVAVEQSGSEAVLAFVEVKARNVRNWDQDGLLAITAAKRRKLIKTAQLYLGSHLQFETFPCRFDVALVQIMDAQVASQMQTHPKHWVDFGRDRLFLKEYIRGAFEAD